jgi:hypothetical protein
VLRAPLCCGFECAVERVGAGYFNELEFEAEGSAGRVRGVPVALRRVQKHRNPARKGQRFMQQLQALCAQFAVLIREAGQISAGMGQAGHQPGFDCVVPGTITIGIVEVTSISARTFATPPPLTMTSGFCRTNSSAAAARRRGKESLNVG